MKEILSATISDELQNHGYDVVVSKPDLVLKYSFGLRTRASEEVGESSSEMSEQFSSDFSKLPSYEAGLAVQIAEAKSGKVIWKMHATRPLGQRMSGAQEFQEEICGLLNTMPSRTERESSSNSPLGPDQELSPEFSNMVS